MDTIAYMKDPGDSSKVICVIDEHGKLNHKKACKDANDLALLFFDEYDHVNQKDAKRFLLNSLSDDLKKQLNQTVYKNDCFIVYWLELMKILRSVTVEKYYRLMDQMKVRQVSKYPSQNIELI